ncbi:MAG: hypothetical protein IKQ10_08125 [Oscillospiraceae bacterium]|nr:hypothetical protein [Oscillospiraceae bacterium]
MNAGFWDTVPSVCRRILKWVPLEQVRVDCGVSRDGSKAKNILNAAKSYGLIAKGFRADADALREAAAFPCIIYWNYNHYVLLCGFRGKHACINDPARGTVKIPLEEFQQSFSGVALTFTPGESFETGGKRASTLSYARKRLAGAGGAVAFVMLSSVLGYLFTIINPSFSRFFVDRLLTGENREVLLPFIGLVGFVTLLQFIVAAIRGSSPFGSTARWRSSATAVLCGSSCGCRWSSFPSAWRGTSRRARPPTRPSPPCW